MKDHALPDRLPHDVSVVRAVMIENHHASSRRTHCSKPSMAMITPHPPILDRIPHACMGMV